MYCPQCGTESPSGQRFCRSCGANLKVIGKAVALGQAIARGDGGPLPKLKELMESVKVKQATEEVSRALEQMSHSISNGLHTPQQTQPWWVQFKDNRTPEERREDHIVKGTVSLFSGIALMIFLYYFLAALVLKIPAETLARLPFEVEPLLRVFWLIGLLPTLSGLGRIVAGLMIKATRTPAIKDADERQQAIEDKARPALTQGFTRAEESTGSVVERTTELLDGKAGPLR